MRKVTSYMPSHQTVDGNINMSMAPCPSCFTNSFKMKTLMASNPEATTPQIYGPWKSVATGYSILFI